jgi:hypothetical protein
MALTEVMLNVSKDHHEGNQVKVSKSIDMFSTSTLVRRTSVKMPKPHGDDHMLDPQCNEAHHQVHFP